MNQPNLLYTTPPLPHAQKQSLDTTREQLDAWNQNLIEYLPLSQPKAKVLALFSFALAKCRRCTLSIAAQALHQVAKADTIERRFQRFLAQGPLDLPACQSALVRWVIGHWPRGQRLVLLIDETSLQEHLRVMATSIAYKGRALPLCWNVYACDAAPTPRPLIQEQLARIAAQLPPGIDVLVQADRGIGCDPDLLRFIEGLGWKYLMRVQGQVRLRLVEPDPTMPATELIFAQQIAPPTAQQASALCLEQVQAFKKGGWVPCRALGLWHPDAKEPWLLLTNCPAVRAQAYGLRMWEESAFKDFKSNGWQWQRSRVWNPEHADRLWLVMSLGYLLMLSLGAQVLEQPSLRKEVTRGRGVRHSVFQIGLRALSRLSLWSAGISLLKCLCLWPSQQVWQPQQLKILKTVVQ